MTWDDEVRELPADQLSFSLSGMERRVYFFKLTAVDAVGNESRWEGVNAPQAPADRNCEREDFSSVAAAQRFFDFWYPYYGDVADLDGDGDLRACESGLG